MINIQKGQSDSSAVVGVIVVLVIVGLVGFGIYYMGFIKPSREELSDAKTSAKKTLVNLKEVGTSQASSKTSEFLAKINGADEKSEVNSIVKNIQDQIKIESKRLDLLNLVENATRGSFYDLSGLRSSLKKEINSKTKLDGLNTLSNNIEGTISSEWREKHRNRLNSIGGSEVVKITEDSPLFESHMSKSKSLSLVSNEDWKTLSKLKFQESNTFKVAITQAMSKTPTLEKGSKINVYEYNSENESMNLRVEDTTVLEVFYPKDLLSTISWTKNEVTTENRWNYSFSTDVWEEIKASYAGAENAKSVWNDWAKSVIKKAREDTNLVDYDLEALYLIEVTNGKVAKKISKIEQFQEGKKSILLISKKT